jgi:hypothetical protein
MEISRCAIDVLLMILTDFAGKSCRGDRVPISHQTDGSRKWPGGYHRPTRTASGSTRASHKGSWPTKSMIRYLASILVRYMQMTLVVLRHLPVTFIAIRSRFEVTKPEAFTKALLPPTLTAPFAKLLCPLTVRTLHRPSA